MAKKHIARDMPPFEISSEASDPWWDTHLDNEERPEWGQYYDDLFPMENYENWFHRPIFSWVPLCIGYTEISMEELHDITQWAKENIDNVWEGPIGYMGFWKFKFTTEEDRLAFKLYI